MHSELRNERVVEYLSEGALVWRLGLLLMVLVLAGYPLIGVVLAFLNVPSEQLTIPFRVTVFGIAVCTIILSLTKGIADKPDLRWTLFLLLYGARLGYDWLFAGIVGADSAALFFTVVVVVPAVACLYSGAASFNEKVLARWLYWVLLSVSGLALIASVSGLAYNAWAEQGVETDRLAFEALNSISLGFAGGMGFICSVYLLSKSARTWTFRVFLCASMIVFTTVFMQANSRGPLIGTLLGVLYLSFSQGTRINAALLLIGAIGLGVVGDQWNLEAISERFAIVDQADGYEDSVSERVMAIESAIDAFVTSPIFGAHYLDPKLGLGFYPHNLPVEIAMSMGVIGLALGAFLYYRGFLLFVVQSARKHPLVGALMIQQFVQTMVSGALWASDAWFLFLGIGLTITARNRRKAILAKDAVAESM